MTEALVDVREVNRSFRGAGSVVHAVRDVTLQVYSGEFVALRGRSGSGKTTLLNLIAGLDRPESGSIHLEGEEISSASEARLTEMRRHSIGFVFQSFALLPLFSARENVELALRIAGVHGRAASERANEALDLVGLGPICGRGHGLHFLHQRFSHHGYGGRRAREREDRDAAGNGHGHAHALGYADHDG